MSELNEKMIDKSTEPAPVKPDVKPWRRYFARVMDYFLFVILLGPICAWYAPWVFEYALIIQSMFILGLWVLIEPIFMFTFGYTPGKFLFNIKVRTKNGMKLTFTEALTRSFRVWFSGLAFGLPLINIGCMLYEYKRLKDTGTNPWDRDTNLVVYEKVGPLRVVFIGLVLTAYAITVYFNITGMEPLTFEQMNTEANKKLPMKLDDETIFQKIEFTPSTITYQYQLINQDVKNVDKEEIKKSISGYIQKAFCKPENLKALPRGSDKITYIYQYFDKNQEPLATYEISTKDCAKE